MIQRKILLLGKCNSVTGDRKGFHFVLINCEGRKLCTSYTDLVVLSCTKI